MKTLATTVTLLFLIGARTAAAQDVRYDFDKDKDFSKFKTYKDVPIKGADEPDGLTVKQLVTAMDAELAKKRVYQDRCRHCCFIYRLPDRYRIRKTVYLI